MEEAQAATETGESTFALWVSKMSKGEWRGEGQLMTGAESR